MPEMTDAWLTAEQQSLIGQWRGLVHFVMRKRRACWSRMDQDTAQMHAEDALIEAARAFNPNKPGAAKFNTYAIQCIYRYLCRQNSREGVVVNKMSVRTQGEPFACHFLGDGSGFGARFLLALADRHDDVGCVEAEEERARLAASVREALSQLEPRTRTVLWLRLVEQQKLRQVAEVLGVCKERVRQIEQLGRERLAAILSVKGLGTKEARDE